MIELGFGLELPSKMSKVNSISSSDLLPRMISLRLLSIFELDITYSLFDYMILELAGFLKEDDF